jgi:integrase/recombinase XerD
MTTFKPYDVLPPARLDPLRLAAAAYPARYKGQSRVHTECDLRAYLRWCAERAVDPLNTSRPYVELYVRWMQEERHYPHQPRPTPQLHPRRLHELRDLVAA